MKNAVPLHVELIDALIPIVFGTTATLNKIGADNDLSLTQLRVMGIQPRMAELADYLGLKKSTMSGLIDRAEKKRLLARTPSLEDSRAIEVFLTEEGQALVERLHLQLQESLAPMTSRLNPSEQRQLRELLDRMHGTD
jgi:DNA-binding MarR family transcriptional regulator